MPAIINKTNMTVRIWKSIWIGFRFKRAKIQFFFIC